MDSPGKAIMPCHAIMLWIALPDMTAEANETHVSGFDPSKNSKQNSLISIRPILRIAAFVFPPMPNPSTNPAASATMFLRAPLSETPETSSTVDTLKVGEWNTAFQSSESSWEGVPIVVSQNWSFATMLLGISAEMQVTKRLTF